jgi:hypothetical protein
VPQLPLQLHQLAQQDHVKPAGQGAGQHLDGVGAPIGAGQEGDLGENPPPVVDEFRRRHQRHRVSSVSTDRVVDEFRRRHPRHRVSSVSTARVPAA